VLADVASGMTPAEAVGLIRRGRLIGPGRAARDIDRERRVVAAWTAAKQLRDDRDVVAVIGLGRGFRDAEVELLAVTQAASGDGVVAEGVKVERRSLDMVEHALTCAGSLEALRAAARVGNGVPLWDPDGLAPGFAVRSAALVPPAAVIESLLARAASLRAAAVPTRATLRRLNHTLAVLLLSLDPLRYDRARWTIDDLGAIGEARLAAALLRSFGAPVSSRLAGARTVAAVREADGAIGPHADRDRADAERLLATGNSVLAAYTAWAGSGSGGDLVDVLEDGPLFARDALAPHPSELRIAAAAESRARGRANAVYRGAGV
jgi:hypothetical protein